MLSPAPLLGRPNISTYPQDFPLPPVHVTVAQTLHTSLVLS